MICFWINQAAADPLFMFAHMAPLVQMPQVLPAAIL